MIEIAFAVVCFYREIKRKNLLFFHNSYYNHEEYIEIVRIVEKMGKKL